MDMPAYSRVLKSLLLALTIQVTSAQAQSDHCSLYTAGEMSKLAGTPVESGEPAAMGTGCQWFGKDEKSYAIVQVLDTTYWLDPRQAPGYEAIGSIGKRAYSHPDQEGGWRAMALTDKTTSTVVLIGKTATRAAALTILRKLVGP
jgi:hypothetical protein